MGYGTDSHLGICFQESFGTSYVSSFHYFPIISESLAEAIPELISEGNRGRYEEGPSYEGPHDITGDIVTDAHPILVGKLLKGWCGQSSSVLATSHYTHTFDPKTSDFDKYAAVPPCTIEVYRDSGSGHQYYDCLVDALNIEIAHGQLVKLTASVKGGKFEKVAKTTPSYLSGSDYTWDQVSVAVGSAGTLAAVDEITSLVIACNNALEGKGTLDGTKTFNRIKRSGKRKIEISGVWGFEDDTQFDNFRNQVEQRMLVTITGQEVSSGYNAVMKIDLPAMRFNEYPVNIGGPGYIETSFKANAKYHSGSGTMATFTVVNTQSIC